MRLYKFELPGTATYRSRSGLWLSGVGSGDGVLTLTTVHAKGFRVDADIYGVVEVNPESHGERRFTLVKATEGDGGEEQESPYEVSVQRGMTSCTCQSGRMGFRTSSCKHSSVILALIAAGQLPRRVLSGA